MGILIIISHHKIIEVQSRIEQLVGVFEFLNSFPGSQSRPALFLIFLLQLYQYAVALAGDVLKALFNQVHITLFDQIDCDIVFCCKINNVHIFINTVDGEGCEPGVVADLCGVCFYKLQELLPYLVSIQNALSPC